MLAILKSTIPSSKTTLLETKLPELKQVKQTNQLSINYSTILYNSVKFMIWPFLCKLTYAGGLRKMLLNIIPQANSGVVFSDGRKSSPY